jgi:hypothetical protein
MRPTRHPRQAVTVSPEQRRRALQSLTDLYARRGVTLRPEHHVWARRALGVAAAPAPRDASAR